MSLSVHLFRSSVDPAVVSPVVTQAAVQIAMQEAKAVTLGQLVRHCGSILALATLEETGLLRQCANLRKGKSKGKRKGKDKGQKGKYSTTKACVNR